MSNQDHEKNLNPDSVSDETYDAIIAEIRSALSKEQEGGSMSLHMPESAEKPAPRTSDSILFEYPEEKENPDILFELPHKEHSDPASIPVNEEEETAGDLPDSEMIPTEKTEISAQTKPEEVTEEEDQPSSEPKEKKNILDHLNFGEVTGPVEDIVPESETLSADSNEQPVKTRRMQIKVSEDDLNRPVFDDRHQRWNDDSSVPPIQHDQGSGKKKKRKKKRNGPSCIGWVFRFLVIIALLAAMAIGCMGMVYAAGDLLGLDADDSNITVTFEPDTSIEEVANILNDNEIIKYPVVFRAYIRYKYKNDVNFNYGTFILKPSMSYDDIVNELEQTTESNDQVTLTFPEGYTILDMAAKLQENSVCTEQEFIDAVNNNTYDYDFLESCYENRDSKAYVLEGYLFPDTYVFTENEDVDDVICTFLNNFDNKYTNVMRNQTANAGRTIDEVVTLASIIESEAPDKSNMEKVSSVLQNRLSSPESFYSLQCDPTTRYAENVLAAEGFDSDLCDSYDTYKCAGLPAGAINNPGINAIKASLFPADTDYFYYCSNTSTGEFFYAATYEQHQSNLRLAGLEE